MKNNNSYGWIIDVDHVKASDAPEGTNLNARGLTGPHDITPDTEKLLREHGAGHPFRLLDDDREIYYEGRQVFSPADKRPADESFAPLDDFGRPNAGCTILQYRDVNGTWRDL